MNKRPSQIKQLTLDDWKKLNKQLKPKVNRTTKPKIPPLKQHGPRLPTTRRQLHQFLRPLRLHLRLH